MKITRLIEILLGLVFVSTALMKAVDLTSFAVQVSHYRVLDDPDLVRVAAVLTTLLETTLGALLLAGLRLRGLTYAVTVAVLVGFTGLIAYAWAFHGLADCGCFGSYMQTGPASSMSKNGVMVGFLIWAWRRYRRAKANADSTGKSVCGGLPLGRCVLALACVLAMGLVAAFYGFDQVETSRKPGTTTADKAERPFAQFVHESNDGVVYDLGEGEYLVVMLSATCEHCMGSVELLNEVSGVSGAPPMVGLMMGTAEERDTFIDATGPFFPIFLTDPVEFFRFIGGAPPRLHYVHAGRSLQHWDWLEDAALPEPTDVVEQVDKLRDNR